MKRGEIDIMMEVIMKRMVYRYKISKFKRCMNGMIFGFISIVALLLCLSDLSHYTSATTEVILPFFIAIVSMILGLFTMLREQGRTKGKIQKG